MFTILSNVCVFVASEGIVTTGADEQGRSPQNAMLKNPDKLWQSTEIPYVLCKTLGKCILLTASGRNIMWFPLVTV